MEISHATRDHLGYLPSGMARMAASPLLLDGFMKLSGMFERCTLDPLAREVDAESSAFAWHRAD